MSLARQRNSGATPASPLGAATSALLLTLLPKCPACAAGYVALLSALGVRKLPTTALALLALVVLAIALVLLGRAAWTRRRPLPFALALAGAVVVLAGRWLGAPLCAPLAGAALLFVGARAIVAKAYGEPLAGAVA